MNENDSHKNPKKTILKLTKPTLVLTCLFGQPVIRFFSFMNAALTARNLAEKLRAEPVSPSLFLSLASDISIFRSSVFHRSRSNGP